MLFICIGKQKGSYQGIYSISKEIHLEGRYLKEGLGMSWLQVLLTANFQLLRRGGILGLRRVV